MMPPIPFGGVMRTGVKTPAAVSGNSHRNATNVPQGVCLAYDGGRLPRRAPCGLGLNGKLRASAVFDQKRW